MKITAQFSFWAGVVFAVLCGAYGVYGLSSLNGLTAEQQADGRGFAMFFLFLALIGVAMAFVSRKLLQGRLGPLDE